MDQAYTPQAEKELLESLKAAIVEIDADRAKEAAQKIIAAGHRPP